MADSRYRRTLALAMLAVGVACAPAGTPRQAARDALRPGQPWAEGVAAAEEHGPFGGSCKTADGRSVFWIVTPSQGSLDYVVQTPSNMTVHKDPAAWRAAVQSALQQSRCVEGVLLDGSRNLVVVQIDSDGKVAKVVEPPG